MVRRASTEGSRTDGRGLKVEDHERVLRGRSMARSVPEDCSGSRKRMDCSPKYQGQEIREEVRDCGEELRTDLLTGLGIWETSAWPPAPLLERAWYTPSWDFHRMTRKQAGETLVSISQMEKLIRLDSLWLGLLVGLQFYPAENSTDG